MNDGQAHARGFHYKILGPRGRYLYARNAAEANALQRRLHSHSKEAPPVLLIRPPIQPARIIVVH